MPRGGFARPDGGRVPGAYTFGTVAALNTLSAALLWFVAANIASIALGRKAPHGFWRNWLLAQTVILLLCLPWFLAVALHGQRGVMGGLDWVPPLSWGRLWWTLSSTYFMYVTSLITVRVFAPGVPGFGLLVFAMAVCGGFALRRRAAPLDVLAASA